MGSIMNFFIRIFSSFSDLSLLLLRFTLAYGFYEPALKKLAHFNDIVIWFDQGLHLPFPYLNAVMATGAEALGVIALVLGLKTRFFALPLMVTMLVAIFVVHFDNGFAAKANGFEIPFYYFVMLSVVLTHGAGKYSLDARD